MDEAARAVPPDELRAAGLRGFAPGARLMAAAEKQGLDEDSARLRWVDRVITGSTGAWLLCVPCSERYAKLESAETPETLVEQEAAETDPLIELLAKFNVEEYGLRQRGELPSFYPQAIGGTLLAMIIGGTIGWFVQAWFGLAVGAVAGLILGRSIVQFAKNVQSLDTAKRLLPRLEEASIAVDRDRLSEVVADNGAEIALFPGWPGELYLIARACGLDEDDARAVLKKLEVPLDEEPDRA